MPSRTARSPTSSATRRPASLSRRLQSAHESPRLYHSLSQKNNSVLSLAACDQHIYSASQGDDVLVWDKTTFTLKTTLKGHTASVLALEYAPDKRWLFSASGDSSIRVWSTETFRLLFVLSPYGDTDSGDLFSLSWSPSLSTIYLGCQNTSLQWFTFTPDILQCVEKHACGSLPPQLGLNPMSLGTAILEASLASGTATPRQAHRFFDSYPRYQRRPADLNARNSARDSYPSSPSNGAPTPPSIDDTCLSSQPVQVPLAHLQVPQTNVIWSAHYGYVYCMALLPSIREGSDDPPVNDSEELRLVTGSGDATVKVWSLSSTGPSLQHTIECGQGAVLALVVRGDTVYAGCQDGYVKIWDLETRTLVRSIIVVEIWDVDPPSHSGEDPYSITEGTPSPMTSGDHTNPLVLATFKGTHTQRKNRRVLFYGHYDVIPAPTTGWSSDPFSLYALNGYLYGRGITDNKGPIMAVACAAASLLQKRALDLDLVMVIEGEEESGSGGFSETVKKHQDLIGPIDAILVSNSTWISEDSPCITYGLRGVIHCQVQISNKGADLHSGVDGGATAEPMVDMVKLLGSLIDQKKVVAIPGFYDNVRPLGDDEKQLYKVLSGVTQTPASSLSAKWREPSLTIHDIEVSGPRYSTVIPATVKSRISLRIVPDQDLNHIATSLQEYLQAEFKALQSPNSLEININHKADWWLGNLTDPWFTTLEGAIRDEWGVEPLRIREGGSIPSVPYLEKEFGCHALHLPLGQSSDQAHLPNERMSVQNLQKGKSVVERFLLGIAKVATED
ncbi:hypothetical protein NLI96_g6169 [Meripilus lineatus]|uniref:Peptidase M20 dimerisation domain-containing protein n=1 Tax=Meripilus lineatus TaxID=2056292 RepID=A0AAD5YG65_9APHY|nr:hypothetical protein NLI96_g6169 [Physisporinus lineatus]